MQLGVRLRRFRPPASPGDTTVKSTNGRGCGLLSGRGTQQSLLRRGWMLVPSEVRRLCATHRQQCTVGTDKVYLVQKTQTAIILKDGRKACYPTFEFKININITYFNI